MKKLIPLFIISILFLASSVWAVNTHYVDLEEGLSQRLKTTSNEVGLPTGGTDRSYEAWVKIEAPAGVLESVVTYGAPSTRAKWGWVTSTNNKQTVETHGQDASNESITALRVGEWEHIAITYDGTTIRYYLNGQPDGTATFALAISTQADTIVKIGANMDDDNFWDGLIDDVRIWDDIRTAQEISDNYNCSLDGNEPGLVAYWKFDGDPGLLDETTNDNDLTEFNNPDFLTSDLPFTASCTVAVTPPPVESDGILFGF